MVHFVQFITFESYQKSQKWTPIGVFVKSRAATSTSTLTPAPTSRQHLTLKKEVAAAPPAPSSPVLGNSPDDGVDGPNLLAGERVGDPNGIDVTSKERYKYELKLFIDNNKEYPRLALKQGQEGQVKVSFVVNRNGTITNVKLLKSCPFARLNEATLDFFRRFNAFKEFPDELSDPHLELTYLIDYKLF